MSSLRRAAFSLVPTSRRVKPLGGAHGRALLQLRKLVAPLSRATVTIQARSGLRLAISVDPVDELIADELLGANRSLYLPPWPERARPPRRILDIGAHHGLYAAAALHEYAEAELVCAEPSAQARLLIEHNLELNGFARRARIVTAAVAEQPGRTVLHHSHESWGHTLFDDDDASGEGEAVTAATLTDILDGFEPDVVKCNAEGAEFAALPQLFGAGHQPALLIVMIHPAFGDAEALRRSVADAGYHERAVGREKHPAFHYWRHDLASAAAGPG